jgi:endoglycosylceramidase
MAAVALAILAALGAAQAAAAKLPKLHVGGELIRDAYGRQVLLRGINDTSLTDQYQVNPDLPTVVPLQASDYDRMQSFGFNVLRLAVNWSKLEPRRGQISEDYIHQIADIVHNAADHGMYTVIDMHSGGWGKYIATPPGATCPEGLRPSHGWMGAPKWATFTDGKTTCHDDKTNKRTPAARQAWTNFWQNYAPPAWGRKARGIQDHLVGVWAALAREFANDRALAGYDLLNEADPGYVGRKLQRFYTGRFDARAIKAIRRSEQRTHGFSHMVMFEANLTWSQHGLASHSPRPGFSDDSNLVYAPHLYGRDVHTTARPVKGVKRDLLRQARKITRLTRQYGTPWWIGEWSFSPFDEDAFRKLLVHIRIQDSNQLGSAWWQWRVACGAPQTFDGLDPTPTHHVLGNINPTKCPEGDPRPLAKGWRGVIARAYPRYSPGRLTALRSRGQRMKLEGESRCGRSLKRRKPKACQLVVWIPNKNQPKVRGRHVSHIRVHRQRGGWVATATVGREYLLRTR